MLSRRMNSKRTHRALSIRPKIPKNPGGEANGTDIFRNFIPKIWVYFDHSCSGLVSPSLKIEFNMVDPQASKYNINALPGKQLKYITSILLQWIGLNKL